MPIGKGIGGRMEKKEKSLERESSGPFFFLVLRTAGK